MKHGAHALQVKVLSARLLRSWWRSPVNLVVQAAQYLFFAFLIGAQQQRMHANRQFWPVVLSECCNMEQHVMSATARC